VEEVPFAAVEGQLEAVQAAQGDRDELFTAVGDLLFSVVNVARKLKVDPELSLRASSGRFRGRVEAAQQLAAQAGVAWDDASPDTKLHFYAQARLNEAP
ncbi:MAG: nucleoside triphosphate diphosphatase, partial [Solirubrobacteraceae bacterium]|nr:nucleoside triphosphate diphosphatase [Solirubrobacteraceae bacterium]